MTEPKRPLNAALDLVIFAPLGMALEARELLPRYIERGRNQLLMTKMIGKFAVDQGQVEAEKGLAKLADKADGLLEEFGLRSPAGPVADPAAAEAPAPTPLPERRTSQSGAEAVKLAIKDYDSLAASQVIPRLEGLSPEELEEVAQYEGAHRGRKTILGKITQLRDN